MNNRQDHRVYISVDEPYSGAITAEWLERVAEAGLGVALGASEPTQMSLLITTDDIVHGLNKQYRGLDQVTDVLSFSSDYAGHWEGAEDPAETSGGDVVFVLPPDEPSPLGEVIVSYPQAKRQAETHHIPLEQELAHLIVHGMLHLTGHDHLEQEETALMQSKERRALQSLGMDFMDISEAHSP